MSYTMTHLIIANEYAKSVDIENYDMFMLGSISPDAVHSSDHFSFDLKADAHDLQKSQKWGRIYTKEEMDIWYDRLRVFYEAMDRRAESRLEKDYVLGYCLHILVDIFNCAVLYGPNLIKYNFDADAMREIYRKECILQDNYLYQNYGESEKILNAAKSAAKDQMKEEILEKLELTQFFNCENLKANVDYHINEYLKADKAGLEGLSMISVQSTEDIIDKVTQGCKRMLPSFPPCGDTFTI